MLRLDAQRLAGRLVGQRRQTQVRAHVEQVVLKGAEQLAVGTGVRQVLHEQTQDGVQLVHAAVGRDPRVVLGDPRAVAQGGFAGVAGLGVDARQEDHDGAP